MNNRIARIPQSQRTTIVVETPNDPPKAAIDAALATLRAIFRGDQERASAFAGLGAHIVVRQSVRNRNEVAA